MARINLIAFGMMSMFMGAVGFTEMYEGAREGEVMKTAVDSGKARRTKAVVVSVWEEKNRHGRPLGDRVTLKVKDDGGELVRKLGPWVKSWLKVGSEVTVYGFEGRYHVPNMDVLGGEWEGRWVALGLLGWPPVVFLGLAVRSWMRKRRP